MRFRRDPARARLRGGVGLLGLGCFVGGIAALFGAAAGAVALGTIRMAAAQRDRRDELLED